MVGGAQGAPVRWSAMEALEVNEECRMTTTCPDLVILLATRQDEEEARRSTASKGTVAAAGAVVAVVEEGTTATRSKKGPALEAQFASRKEGRRATASKEAAEEGNADLLPLGAVAEGGTMATKAPALGSQLARGTARKQMPAAVEATPSKQDSALEARAICPCSKRRAAVAMVPQGKMQAFHSRMDSQLGPTAGGKSCRRTAS
jgi:hypothetical protein